MFGQFPPVDHVSHRPNHGLSHCSELYDVPVRSDDGSGKVEGGLTRELHSLSLNVCRAHGDFRKLASLLPSSLITEHNFSHLHNVYFANDVKVLGKHSLVRCFSFRFGARPEALCGQSRFFLHNDPDVIVLQVHLDAMIRKAGIVDGYKEGMVAGSLHRMSIIRRANGGSASGLTIRVGYTIIGACSPITDLLAEHKSLLILGQPNCGKTTVLRDAARFLADQSKAIAVIDTTGEMCGSADLPHVSLGLAWSIAVHPGQPILGAISEVVRSHSPDAVVVDFQDMQTAIAAAVYCKKVGVRLLGAVQCTLRSFVADLSSNVSEEFLARGWWRLPPTDALVELPRLGEGIWQVVPDVGRAIDSYLAGEQCEMQHRVNSGEASP